VDSRSFPRRPAFSTIVCFDIFPASLSDGKRIARVAEKADGCLPEGPRTYEYEFRCAAAPIRNLRNKDGRRSGLAQVCHREDREQEVGALFGERPECQRDDGSIADNIYNPSEVGAQVGNPVVRLGSRQRGMGTDRDI